MLRKVGNKTGCLVAAFFFILLSYNCSQQTKLGIGGLPNFSVNIEKIEKSFYMPDTHLVMSSKTALNRTKRFSHKFSYKNGPNFLIHAESFYYNKFGVIEPDYIYQFNLEIPKELFVENERISASDIKGYLVWSPVNSAYSEEYFVLEPREGYVGLKAGELHIIKIENDDDLVATANLFFRNKESGEYIRIFGDIKISLKTKSVYQSEENSMIRDTYREAGNVNSEAWDPANYRRMINFESK